MPGASPTVKIASTASHTPAATRASSVPPVDATPALVLTVGGGKTEGGVTAAGSEGLSTAGPYSTACTPP
eukprot:2422331-Pyramimonas_sp.AAC.1